MSALRRLDSPERRFRPHDVFLRYASALSYVPESPRDPRGGNWRGRLMSPSRPDERCRVMLATGMETAKSTVLFMCPYGGAKSVIAASYFNRLALDQALPFKALAAAAEEPYDAVPPNVADLLAREGLGVGSFKPRRVEPADLRAASKVISIDCDLSDLDMQGARVERWDHVPKVSVDLPGSAAAIRTHVELLVGQLKVGR